MTPEDYARKLESELKQWTLSAKSVNVYVLALSALIKKLSLIKREEAKRDFPPNLVDSIAICLMIRYDTLLNDLVDEWEKIVSLSVANEFERLHVFGKLEDTEIFQYSKLVIETIDRLRYIDIREHVIWIRTQCEQKTKLSEISEFLEKNLETKISLPVIK